MNTVSRRRTFSLVGVDGNAFAIMGYTADALRKAGLNDKLKEMFDEASSGTYEYLIATCQHYVDMANEAVKQEEGDEDPEIYLSGVTITAQDIEAAERVLRDNGIEPDEVDNVLQAIGYTLLDTELYP